MEASEQRVTTADLTANDTDAADDGHGDVASAPHDESARDDMASEPLLPEEDSETFQGRWRDIQVRFVDEPQGAVTEADGLVAELMQRLAGTFADERNRLEAEWERGGEVSTEDLRQALQHYRSFFNRLLSA